MKSQNEYALALDTFGRTPKAVLAAVAYSFAARIAGSDSPTIIEAAILEEWAILHANGIVPQSPIKAVR